MCNNLDLIGTVSINPNARVYFDIFIAGVNQILP